MLTSLISLFIAPEGPAVGGAATASSSAAAATSAAEGAAGQAPASPWSTIIMIVVMIAIFYFLLIRPQQKRQKEIKKMREALKVGDNVVTAGGIYGKITDVKDDAFILSISDGVKIKVDKGSVYASIADATASQQAK